MEYCEEHNFLNVGNIFKFAKIYWKLREQGPDIIAEPLQENYDEVESSNVSTFTLQFRELTAEEMKAAQTVQKLM